MYALAAIIAQLHKTFYTFSHLTICVHCGITFSWSFTRYHGLCFLHNTCILYLNVVCWMYPDTFHCFHLCHYYPHHCKALNSLICADVPLRNYSLTRSVNIITCQPEVFYADTLCSYSAVLYILSVSTCMQRQKILLLVIPVFLRLPVLLSAIPDA